MKQKDKIQFKRKAADNNGLVRVNLPQEIANHLDLEKGDTIALQTEHSKQHGAYASLWNKTKQEQGEE